MFSATRIATGVAVLALAGSLALVATPIGGPGGPTGALMEDIDPTDFGGFSGTMFCAMGDFGTETKTEWGSIVEGENYPRCTLDVDDPRISGKNHSIHDWYDYNGRPEWGVRSASSVITNDGGQWLGTGRGYQHPDTGAMHYEMTYRGSEAYEGLTAILVLSQERWGLTFDAEGVIVPGVLPPFPDLPTDESLAASD